MTDKQVNIIVLGGGSAGWMAATAIQHALKAHNTNITLVESPSIGTIGVGEGSTPHLKKFFDQLQVPESEWMHECHATYKNGISFVDWSEHLPENRYFHPFPSIIDRQTAGAFLQHCMARHHGKDVEVNPDHFFLARTLSKKALGPIVKSGAPNVAMNYAYHFDSNLLGQYLAKLAVKKGVAHIQGNFVAAQDDESGNIKTITLEDGRVLNADFFIDASGFSSHLLQQHKHIGFDSFSNNLFNDAAIALPSEVSSPILPETQATALKFGWAWQIPLTNRTGNGYVFSQKYTDFDSAEQELREYLLHQGHTIAETTKARRIHMKVGQVKQAWHKNVMAIGLAQGFIEPLEATALHLVMDSIDLFLTVFKRNEYQQSDIDAFNHAVRQRYEGIRDYIVCHYKVNQLSRSQYWRDAADMPEISDNLQAVLTAWRNKQDITPVLEAKQMLHYYPAVSWYCLLAGYGYYPHSTELTKAGTYSFDVAKVNAFLHQRAELFLPHQALL
jgi:2-polyprenyl-6-methoxyphenol hydroxylase-like FAD-dependent oxidoreductase